MKNSLKIIKRCCSNRLILSRTLYNPHRNNFKQFTRYTLPSTTFQGIRAMHRISSEYALYATSFFIAKKSSDHTRLMLNAKLEREEDTLNLNAYKRSDM